MISTTRTLLLAALLPLALSAATQTWTNLDGQKMEAELIARKGDYVSFKKADGARFLYPYAKLNEADRARVDTLTAGQDTSPVPDSPTHTEESAPAGNDMTRQLNGKLVAVKGKSLAPFTPGQFADTKIYALYYSAQWCPPCRAFTPELVESYKKIKAAHPEFELVFVSSDQDEKSMLKYMVDYGMPWPALRFDVIQSGRLLNRPAHERGIPNLVFTDANGKDLSVSYGPDGSYLGPRKVLADIRKHFKM